MPEYSKSSEDKWKYSLISGILFFIIANPTVYKTVDKQRNVNLLRKLLRNRATFNSSEVDLEDIKLSCSTRAAGGDADPAELFDALSVRALHLLTDKVFSNERR